jgi:two-component sensor histidine kinase/PAS domain-containing protein
MQGLQFISFLFMIYSSSFILIYLIEAMYERLTFQAKYRNVLGGFLLGMVVLVIQLVLKGVHHPDMPGSIPDGRFLLIFVSLIYYGVSGGTMTMIVIWSVSLLFGYQSIAFLFTNSLVDYMTGLVFCYWMRRIAFRYHIRAVLLGTAIIQIAALGTVALLMTASSAKLNYFHSFPLIFLILEIYSMSISIIFINNRERRERIDDFRKNEEILQYKTALLESQLHSSIEGILIVDNQGRKVLQNRRMNELWKIPQNIADNVDDAIQILHVKKMAKNPEQFIEKVSYLYENPGETSHDILELIDGTILDRYSSPVTGENGQNYGRIWIFNDITERKLSEEKLLQSLREKETLIRELYHRTKNNMQVICGILSLQLPKFPNNTELKEIIRDSVNRIQSMALVHRMLYKSHDLSRISIKEYIIELSTLIMQSLEMSTDRISLNISVDNQDFLLDTAIPFGLILNELITNSLKYAFPDNRKGLVSIILTREDGNKNILHYSDNGVGVPDGFDFLNQNTLGFKLIHNIAEHQMHGHVAIENTNGISCVIEFPDDMYNERI